MRRAAKRDVNEPEIVTALERVGAMVLRQTHPDLVVGFRGANFLLEVKGTRPQRLQPEQIRLRASWPGQYTIVASVDDALRAIGAIR